MTRSFQIERRPFTEILLDERNFLRLTRVGNWFHTLNYETGEGEWAWAPEERDEQSDRDRSLAGAGYASVRRAL